MIEVQMTMTNEYDYVQASQAYLAMTNDKFLLFFTCRENDSCCILYNEMELHLIVVDLVCF